VLAGPLLALLGTCLLVGVAARYAPRAPGGPTGAAPPEPARGGLLRSAFARITIPVPEAPALFALVPLGVGLGIALALGARPGSTFALAGSFAACTAGHCLLAREPGQGRWGLAGAWFVPIAFCLLAATLRFSTLDLHRALAAQAAAGPGVLAGPPLLSAVDVLGGVVGLVAGAAWVEHLPRLAGPPEAAALDTAMRWGESALAGAAVAATIWGPPAGALLHGPPGALAVPVAISTLVTVLAVAAVSALRTTVARAPLPALLGTLAPAALVALLAARLA